MTTLGLDVLEPEEALTLEHYQPRPKPAPVHIQPRFDEPIARTDWRDLAACRDADTNVFFPDGEDRGRQAALLLCDGCPVRQACLDFAIEHNERGIWGGTYEQQRRKLRRKVA